MRQPEFTEKQIIEAGNALLERGEVKVTGWQIRKVLGGGRSSRYDEVWKSHITENVIHPEIDFEDLPVEDQQLTETIYLQLKEFSVKKHMLSQQSIANQVETRTLSHDDEIKGYAQDILDMSETIEKYEIKIQDQLQIIVHLENKIEDERNEASKLEGQIVELKRQIDEIKKENDELITSYDKKITDLNREIGKNNFAFDKVGKLEKEISQKNTKIKSIESKNKSLEKRLQSKNVISVAGNV